MTFDLAEARKLAEMAVILKNEFLKTANWRPVTYVSRLDKNCVAGHVGFELRNPCASHVPLSGACYCVPAMPASFTTLLQRTISEPMKRC